MASFFTMNFLLFFPISSLLTSFRHYPHGFPHSVENYMGVIHPQAVDNVVDKSWISGG